jgi:hypothetical protein
LIDAQEVTIVGNIYAKNITLDVSEKLDLHGKLIADEGPAMLTGGARVAFGGAPSSEGTLDVSEALNTTKEAMNSLFTQYGLAVSDSSNVADNGQPQLLSTSTDDNNIPHVTVVHAAETTFA